MKITALTVYPENTIREVIACIDRNEKGIALVVDEDRHLLATLTDGDICRAILAGFGLDERVHILIEKKAQSAPDQPVTAFTMATS